MGVHALSDFLALGAAAALLQLPILLPGLVFIAAIKLRWFEWLNRPIDAGRTIGGQPIFGPNKTWRAPAFYVVGATLVAVIFHFVWPDGIGHFRVFTAPPWMVGPAIGASYSAGELINSFVKRRVGVSAGVSAQAVLASWVQRSADTVDGALTSGLVYLALGVRPLTLVVSLGMTVIIHNSTDVLMRRLGLKHSHKQR